MSSMLQHFGDVRSLLRGPPGRGRWHALVESLDALPACALQEWAVPYAEEHLASWPAELRTLPAHWERAWRQGQSVPQLSLARRIRIHSDRSEPEPDRIAFSRVEPLLRELELPLQLEILEVEHRVDTQRLRSLSLLDGWKSVRRVHILSGGFGRVTLGGALTGTPLLDELEELVLREFSIYQLQDLSRTPQLAGLRRLELMGVSFSQGLQDLLESMCFPRLVELRLVRSHLGVSGARALAESLHIPALERLVLQRDLVRDEVLEVFRTSRNFQAEILLISKGDES